MKNEVLVLSMPMRLNMHSATVTTMTLGIPSAIYKVGIHDQGEIFFVLLISLCSLFCMVSHLVGGEFGVRVVVLQNLLIVVTF